MTMSLKCFIILEKKIFFKRKQKKVKLPKTKMIIFKLKTVGVSYSFVSKKFLAQKKTVQVYHEFRHTRIEMIFLSIFFLNRSIHKNRQ